MCKRVSHSISRRSWSRSNPDSGYPQKQFSLPMLFVVGYTYARCCGCLSGFLQQQLVYFDPDTAYAVFFSRAKSLSPYRRCANHIIQIGVGVAEYWSVGFRTHHSITPSIQHFSLCYVAERRLSATKPVRLSSCLSVCSA